MTDPKPPVGQQAEEFAYEPCSATFCHHTRLAHCNLSNGRWGCCYCLCESFEPEPVASPVTLSGEIEIKPAAPQNEPLTDVYEVYGSCATSRGWDFLVDTSMASALHHIEESLDSLEDGEEVKIVFKHYTAAQMEEVIYE